MMAAANVLGSIVGVRTALKYGSGFVRSIFNFGEYPDLPFGDIKCLLQAS